MKKIFLFLLISFSFATDISLMFWNVENLFDQINDPIKKDDDFLPAGSKRYTWRSFRLKVEHLADVINRVNPDCLAMVEVENRFVLDVLCKELKHTDDWEIIIDDGPDLRGIDPALIYRKDKFIYCGHCYYPVYFPERDYHSRSIMRVDLCEKQSSDTLCVFINHWPSRRGGKQRSDPYREYASEIMLDALNATLNDHSNYAIVITGDFNDDRFDSCLKALESDPLISYLNKKMPNKIKGTYYHQGEWIHFDHFLTANFANSHLNISSAEIFAPHWIREKPGQGPLRFYKGIKTAGGYSDHYPIILTIAIKNHGFNRHISR